MITESIDAGQDLSFLEKYGLLKIDKNAYEIDVLDHPDWITAKILVMPFYFDRFLEKYSDDLRVRGMTEKDFQIIETYQKNNNYKFWRNKVENSYMRDNKEKLVAEYYTTGSNKYAVFSRYQFELKRILMQYDLEWASGLFQGLDSRARRILLSYLIEKISKIRIHQSTDLSADIDTIFERMRSELENNNSQQAKD